MSKKKFNAMEALKEKMGQQNIGTQINKIQENTNNSLITIKKDNFDTFNLQLLKDWEISNTEDFEFCTEKIVKIGNYVSNTALELGKDFEEIFQRFSMKGSEDGIYEKVIELLGFNKRTILRHRKRYNLFMLTESTEAKEIIAGLSVKNIDLIDRMERNELKECLDNITSKEEFTNFIKSLDMDNYDQKKLFAPEEKSEEIDIDVKDEQEENEDINNSRKETYETEEKVWEVDNILGIFEDYEERYQELNNDEKEKLSSLIKEISAILKK